MADKAVDRHIGARGLRAIMEHVLMPVMYEIPSDRTIERVYVTKSCIEGKETPQLIHKAGVSKKLRSVDTAS